MSSVNDSNYIDYNTEKNRARGLAQIVSIFLRTQTLLRTNKRAAKTLMARTLPTMPYVRCVDLLFFSCPNRYISYLQYFYTTALLVEQWH